MAIQNFVPHYASEWINKFLLDWIYIIGILALALGIWSLFRVSVDKIKNKKPNWQYSYVTLIGLFVMMIFGWTAPVGDSWGMYPVFVIAALGIVVFLILSVASGGNKKLIYLILAAVSLVVTVLIAVMDNSWGFFFMTQEGLNNLMWLRFFEYVMMPILATMFSLLAFFIASAAYRAFRARNLLASLLLIAALIVMLRFNPYMPFPDLVVPFFSKLSNWLMNVPNLAAQRAIVIGVGLGIVATALKVILGIERGYMGKG